MVRWVVRGVIGVVVLVLVLGLLAGGWVTSRFLLTKPQTEGRVEVEGLTGEATVVRDANGVAHIFGQTDADIYFALGYTHASERFFQMDLLRRYVQGRLAELFGADFVRIDARNRIKRFPQTAQASVDNMSPQTRAVIEAYVRGVNARLDRGIPAPEYAILRETPEPWTVLDSAGMGVYMADLLAAGDERDWSYAALHDILSGAQLDAFLRVYPDWAPTTLKDVDVAAAFGEIQERSLAPASAPEAQPENQPGSNAWIVSGERTDSGLPLLASDPHLSLGAPSIWYHVHLALEHQPGIGVTTPGSPFIIMGRNGHGAWAYTNTGFDVIDLVERNRAGLEITLRTETIAVRGRRAVEITVEDTPEGPVMNPEYFNLSPFDPDKAVIWRATVSDPTNDMMDVALGIMQSTDWDSFVEASRGWTAPMQNMHYAGTDGTIGYTTAGLLPIRDADGNWTGYVPFDELPRVSNPRGGFIVSGNNLVAGNAYPYPLPGSYAVYRAPRIEALLEATPLHTRDSFTSIQMDVTSLHAQRLLPALLGAQPESQPGIEGLARLERWDGTLTANGPEGLIFSAWLKALSGMIWSDELIGWARDFAQPRRAFLEDVLMGEAFSWCDNVTTEPAESCALTAGLSLDLAMADLIAQFGPDIDRWEWGSVHAALFDHPAFTGLPVLDGLFTVHAPVGGDGSTINVSHFSYSADSYETYHGASMRAIYDLSDLNASLFMHAPGQSGHPLSPHYRDLAPRWAAGEYYEIRDDWTPDTAPEGSQRLTLRPGR